MNLSFVVLTLHENAEESSCCLKVEDLFHVMCLVVVKGENLGAILDLIVG